MRPALWTSATSAGPSACKRGAGGHDDVLDHLGDLATHQLVPGAHGVEPGIAAAHFRQDGAGKRHLFQHIQREQAGAQPVVDVMGVVGDVVGNRRALRLEAGEAVELEIEQLVEIEDGLRHGALCRDPHAVRSAAHCA